MVPWLGPDDPFPPVERALRRPNGLLAAGGDLSPARLVEAYKRGIFPWFSEGDPLLWWSPDPRMVLVLDELHVARSLARRVRRGGFHVTADAAFATVVDACAAPRRAHHGTWILPSMRRAYGRLHELGFAHSVETWIDGSLAGGLYGVAVGRMFFGESMFTRATDASKLALLALVGQLRRWGFELIDCQMTTSHLAALGAREIPRDRFLARVRHLVALDPVTSPWTLDEDVLGAWERGSVGA
jgi:leucyl/phenylalanyl-tRNA--protein transferase